MRRSVRAFVAIALLLVHVPARAQVIVYDVFSAYLDSLREQAGIPGLAAAIVDADGRVWERAYGFQDVGRAFRTRTDTPFNADGLTQVFTAAVLLRCAEERRLSLDDRVGDFRRVETPEPNASIRQLLSHTSETPSGLAFSLRPDRLAPLWPIVRACTEDSYRETLASLMARLAMVDSVPGPNIISLVPPAEGMPTQADVERYAAILQRRALPYAVDEKGRSQLGSNPIGADVLTPASGLVTSVRDIAKFDLALRQGILVAPETLAQAWTAPAGADGRPLPHGLGWFVQSYNGEKVVWQFGAGENASSALIMTLPSRGLTLILMANSDRLAKPFRLEEGDVSRSPFARLFLSLFVR